ncbi:MAG TPA: glycosyltransferase [Gaiellaceae bacterium]|nr:glycosyltransferase [Gaiellaceae bacterium]
MSRLALNREPLAPITTRVVPLTGPLPLVWYGSLREPSGYADEARTFLLALENEGYAPVARERVWSNLDAGVTGAQLAAIDAAVSRPIPDGDHVWVQHTVPHPSHRNREGARTVVRTMFETDRIPPVFRKRLLEADEVWVPSEFNVETFQRGGMSARRMRVLPETLDFEQFAPGAEPLPVAGTRGFTFLTNFDFTDRKGWDVLLDAWARAFDPDDDVSLVLKCLSLHGGSEEDIRTRIALHLDGRATAPVVVDTRVIPATELPSLYAAADAYVMASRGEGWGRPYMEAMAMGLPTIGTRFGGNLAFMHDGNSFLVDGMLVPVGVDAQQHTPLYAGHRWFQPDAEALAETMRAVAAGGPDVTARAAGARAELIERFGPAPTAARIAELTMDVLERERRPARCVWRGDFGSCHSLAVVNDGHVDALDRAGVEVTLRSADADSVSTDVPGVAGQWPPSFDAPTSGPFVLYQPWEYGPVPRRWVESIRDVVDEVWVPSSYVRDGFIASGVAPQLVHVVPNGVDLERFSPDGPARALPGAHGTVFLFVGGTIPRKGIDVLLDAWATAFDAGDDVTLVVKSFGSDSAYRGQTADELLAAAIADPAQADIVLLDENVPFAQLPALYRAADVLVQPYRAEGFCLPALEALACGVPLIVTAGGPTEDFVSDACAWRVPAARTPMAPNAFEHIGLALAGRGLMLEPDTELLAAALREATAPAERGARAANAREHAERFGWDAAAAAAAARLDALAHVTPIRHSKASVVPGRRGFVFLARADWDVAATWMPALHAYLDAFTVTDNVTLVFPDADGRGAQLLGAELDRVAAQPDELPDIAAAAFDGADLSPLELGSDAVIHAVGPLPARARLVLPPDAAALRAALREAA